ncbi:MAG: TetR/AcrR family transcriptional regulator [Bacteroidota bacterium]
MKERILEHAAQLFMKWGIKNITLDEIARGLGISKKTIYQYFENKGKLVYEVSKAHMLAEEEEYITIAAEAENAIDELARLIQCMVARVNDVHPQIIFEVKKYYPESWNLYDEHKKHFLEGLVRKNLQQGIAEGLYRPSLHVEIITRMRMSQVEVSFDENFFPPDTYDFRQVHIQMFETYMYGIVTEEGRKLLEEYLQRYVTVIQKL